MDAYGTEYSENDGRCERSFSYFHNLLLVAIIGCRNNLSNGMEVRLSKVALVPSCVTRCIDSSFVLRMISRISFGVIRGSDVFIHSFQSNPTCLYRTRIFPNNTSLPFSPSTDACSINV